MSMIGNAPVPAPAAILPPGPHDIRQLAVELVICDDAGRPRRRRLIGIDRLLRHLPPAARPGAAATSGA